ncbi:MAG: hypothetical protein M3A44_10960 [Gammaproteobacteria bacterium]
MVEAFMASEKVADTVGFTVISVAPLVGVMEARVGGVMSPPPPLPPGSDPPPPAPASGQGEYRGQRERGGEGAKE